MIPGDFKTDGIWNPDDGRKKLTLIHNFNFKFDDD